MKTCRFGSSQWCIATMNPKPPLQPSYSARFPVGAERISAIPGTRAT